MKRFMIAILVSIFACIVLPQPAKADDGLIWNYKNDDFLDYLKNDDEKKLIERQKKLDDEIRRALNVNLLPVNLEDCITIMLKNSSTLKIAKENKEEAKWTYANSMTFLLPDFYYRYQIQDVRGEILVGSVLPVRLHVNPVYSGFSVTYPILSDWGQFFQAASSRSLYKAAEHRLNRTREELLKNVATSYYELLQAKLNIEVLIINLRDRQEQLRLMQARHQIGVGTKYDVLRAQAELAKSKMELINSLNSLRLKQASLADAMGLDVMIAVYPMEGAVQPVELVEKKYDIENLYKVALSLRQDVKAKEREIMSLNYLRKKNYADFAPQVALTYDYARQGTLQLGTLRPSTTWGLAAVIPLGKRLGVGTMTQEKADAAKLKAAQYELRKLKGDVKQYILTSYYDSMSALEKIEANKKEVEAADEGVRFALVGFEVGNNDFLDVLNSQATKTQARVQLINSTIEYNKAQVTLLYESGIISPKTLLRCYKTPSVLNQKYRFEE